MPVNKYCFTGSGYDSFQCLHTRAPITIEFSGRDFGFDYGAVTHYHMDGNYGFKAGETAKECCEIGVEITRLGFADLAMKYYRKAVELEPMNLLPHSFLIIGHDYAGSKPAERIQELKLAAGKLVSKSTRLQPHRNSRHPSQSRRIRVGYVSGDFFRHSAFNTWYPMLREHSKDQFEIFAYYTGPIQDDYTHSIRMQVENFRHVATLTDAQLDELIRADEIDILVDLSGHTAGHRLRTFARKPAPIQLTGFGFVEGNGLTTMDYVFGDRLLLSADERKLVGRPVLELPSAFFYEPPADAPAITDLPYSWGEPFTFGCFNKVDKVTDDMLNVWAEIVRHCSSMKQGCRLILKDVWYDNPMIRAQMGVRLHRAGFRSTEVILYGESTHAEHLSLMAEIDCGLDPSPHGGGTSTSEMLWNGIPVVTLFGPAPPGRLTAAIEMRAGLGMFVAQDLKEYVQAAISAAMMPDTLSFLRGSMRARLLQSPLCNIALNVRAIEKHYTEIFNNWRKG